MHCRLIDAYGPPHSHASDKILSSHNPHPQSKQLNYFSPCSSYYSRTRYPAASLFLLQQALSPLLHCSQALQEIRQAPTLSGRPVCNAHSDNSGSDHDSLSRPRLHHGTAIYLLLIKMGVYCTSTAHRVLNT